MSECLLCTGKLGREVFPFATRFNGKTYRYRSCRQCGSSTIDPLPGPDEFAAMYRQDEYHDIFYGEQEEAPTLLKSYLPPTAGSSRRLLDFGCGNGLFLKQAKALGFKAIGVELDPVVREQAAAASDCPVGTLEDVRAKGQKFDVIHLGDVLEHVPDPAGTMRELEHLLASNGVFFIEGPLEANASLVRAAGVVFGEVGKRLGRRSIGSFPPYHLFQTNARAQRDFFEKRLGYRVSRFEVWETGWPYRASSPPETAGMKLRDAIGRASLVAAAVTKPVATLGNRFAALLRPPPR